MLSLVRYFKIVVLLSLFGLSPPALSEEACGPYGVYESLDFDGLTLRITNPWDIERDAEYEFMAKTGFWREKTYDLYVNGEEFAAFQTVCTGNGIQNCRVIEKHRLQDYEHMHWETFNEAIYDHSDTTGFAAFSGEVIGGNDQDRFVALTPMLDLLRLYRYSLFEYPTFNRNHLSSDSALFYRSCEQELL